MIGTSGCYVLVDQPREIEKKLDIRYYAIDPESILELIDKGETDVFIPLENLPEETPSIRPNSVIWSEGDFFKVAHLLHQQSAQEPFEAYNLYSMHFSMDCDDIEQGAFSYASFSFFTLVGSDEQEVRAENTIAVNLTDSWVATYQAEYYPNIRKRKAIDLAGHEISAEAALQIAEMNGGAEKRLEFGNACLIDALTPAAEGEGWKILYVNSKNTLESILEIFIDAKTGVFEIVSTQ
ncbi:MAG: hypothetical protein JW987_10995 [Anaerolineaceae bacterium]|nr:hypothetical protein [Anaerolineaceae bacterium]